jgi:tripartite-type tricarboxylate transporter receptor subunit TctC
MAHWQSLSAYLTTIAIILLALAWVESASAQSAFYKGKTITIVQGRAPGGQGDIRVRALLPILQKNIPGNLAIVSEYWTAAVGARRPTICFEW